MVKTHRRLIHVEIGIWSFELLLENQRNRKHVCVQITPEMVDGQKKWRIHELSRIHHRNHKVEFLDPIEHSEPLDEEQALEKLVEIYRQMVGEADLYSNTLIGRIYGDG